MELPFSFPFINGSRTKSRSSSRNQKKERRFSARTYLCSVCFGSDLFVFGVFRFELFVFGSVVFAVTGVFAPAIPRVILLDQLE